MLLFGFAVNIHLRFHPPIESSVMYGRYSTLTEWLSLFRWTGADWPCAIYSFCNWLMAIHV